MNGENTTENLRTQSQGYDDKTRDRRRTGERGNNRSAKGRRGDYSGDEGDSGTDVVASFALARHDEESETELEEFEGGGGRSYLCSTIGAEEEEVIIKGGPSRSGPTNGEFINHPDDSSGRASVRKKNLARCHSRGGRRGAWVDT